MKKNVIDSRRTLFVFDTEKTLIDYAIDQLVEEANRAMQKRGRFCIALSGGSTPKNFLQALSVSEKAQALDWQKGYIFFSDERAVLPTDDESNYKMAMQFFQNEPFKNAHFFRMQAERENKAEAASEYEQAIRENVAGSVFDIVYLGIGTDGHTASLFPNTDILDNATDLVASAFVEAKNTWRISFTFSLINKAQNIVVLAVGSSKAEILHEILKAKDQTRYPAQRIGSNDSPALFFCDQSASYLCES